MDHVDISLQPVAAMSYRRNNDMLAYGVSQGGLAISLVGCHRAALHIMGRSMHLQGRIGKQLQGVNNAVYAQHGTWLVQAARCDT
jgi:hypothetical protein